MKTISKNLSSIVFLMLFVGIIAMLIANSHHDPLGNNINRQLKEMRKAPVQKPNDSTVSHADRSKQ